MSYTIKALADLAGVTTRELDRIAAEVLRAHGAQPAFLGYPNAADPGHPYPATINASLNDELVHGIPGRRRLREGDILSLDCGTIYEGYVGDSALTVGVGRISAAAQRLLGQHGQGGSDHQATPSRGRTW